MGDNVPSSLIGTTFSDGGQILLGHRLIVEGSLVKKHAQGILTPESEIFEETPGGYQIVVWKLIDQGMEDLSLFHASILHGRSRAAGG